MPLGPVEVEAFTLGRLNRDDDETERQLAAALAAARSYCGWHVTPVIEADEITLDGPGGLILILPTLKLIELTEVTEDGIELDVETLEWSARGMVRKPYSELWSEKFRGITATIQHGYAEAPDFESVVLSAIDRDVFASGSDVLPRVVGPFQYDTTSSSAGFIFSDAERSVLAKYALERAA